MKGMTRVDPTIMQRDQKEEETVSFEVSDEVLEIAGATDMTTPFTMGSCTGLTVCPSW
jgi:hypothetical protein